MMRSIAGLDTAAGLRRVLGKQAAYYKLLHTFVRDQGDLPSRLAERLAVNDRAGAGVLLHTLRGVAGNIGAVKVQTLAQQLEQALTRETPDELAPRQEAVTVELERLLAAIQAALPTAAEAQPLDEQPLDEQQLDAICRRLLTLLADNDSQAENLMQGHGVLLRAAFGERYAGIEAALDQFDFEQAYALLSEALQARRPALENEDEMRTK
jgi:HPt (histidine-containing phosphotransfer) domain-containing protein